MITKERIAELRKLQSLGVTNDERTTVMQECYFHGDGEVNMSVLLDAAESAVELRDASSLVVALLGSRSGMELMHRDASLQIAWKELRDALTRAK